MQQESIEEDTTQHFIQETTAALTANNSSTTLIIPAGVYDLDGSAIRMLCVTGAVADTSIAYDRLDLCDFMKAETLMFLNGEEVGIYQNLTSVEILYNRWKNKKDAINEFSSIHIGNPGTAENLIPTLSKKNLETIGEGGNAAITYHKVMGFKEFFPFIYEDERFLVVEENYRIEMTINGIADAFVTVVIAEATRLLAYFNALNITSVTFFADMKQMINSPMIDQPLCCIETMTMNTAQVPFEFTCGKNRLLLMEGLIIKNNDDTVVTAPLITEANLATCLLEKNGVTEINGSTFIDVLKEFRLANGEETGEDWIPYLVQEEIYNNTTVTYYLNTSANTNEVTVFWKYIVEQ